MKTTAAYAPVETVHERDDRDSTGSANAPVQDAHDGENGRSNARDARKIKQRKCTSAFQNADDNWLIEIICVAVGAVLIVALYLVLQAYDGKPAPKFGPAFGSSLTLNTIVAIIAAAAKIALLFPVAECLGQLRWIWFARDKRQLNDFATFDRAVRGSMWSGFELMWTTKMRSLVSLGAFITLFAVAIDPLSQQLIAYDIDRRHNVDANATIPVVVQYSEVADNIAAVNGPDWKDLQDNYDLSPDDYSYISVGMKSAIQFGFANGNERVPELPAACPGGNCTFDEYSSVAVCVNLEDVTEHLSKTTPTLNKTTGLFQQRQQLTDDHYLVLSSEYDDGHAFFTGGINASSVATSFKHPKQPKDIAYLDFNQSIAFKDLQAPLADIFIITTNQTGEVAFEVALSWCIQSYATEVTNGTTVTTRLTSNHNFTWDVGSSSFTNDAPHPGHPTRGWTVSGSNHAALQWHLKQFFVGAVTQQGVKRTTTTDAAQVLYDPFVDLTSTTPKANLSETLHQTEREGLRLIFDNVAASMTNRVRRSATPSNGTAADRYVVYQANGTVDMQVNVVHIRWPWISAHIVFALFSFGFLVATMISHRMSPLRGTEPWKSSGLAVLHALEPGLQREMGGVDKMTEVQERSEGKLVRLEQVGGEGWRLVEVGEKEMTRR